MREPDGIDEVLTRVHERRGIRELLVVGERDGWPEMDRWRRWWCVDVDYILAASLCVSRPRAIITPNPHPELLARAKWFGVVVWDPFVVPGSGSLAYAPAGAREPATRRVGPV